MTCSCGCPKKDHKEGSMGCKNHPECWYFEPAEVQAPKGGAE